MKVLIILLILASFAMAHVPRNIQPPYVAADFWTQWNSTTPRMALFVLLTPSAEWTGASPVGFTSNTRDMTLPGHVGVTFHSAPGISPSVVEQALGESTTLELSGVYQTGIIERADVVAGQWRNATAEVWSACWNNTELGELVHFSGLIGDLKDYGSYFTVEGQGLIGQLSNEVGEVTQRTCRVKEFGDSRCGKDLTGTVTIGGVAYKIRQNAVDGNPISSVYGIVFDTSTFDGNDPADSAALALYAAAFKNGTIEALDGPNQGVKREIAGAAEATGLHPYMAVYVKRQFPFEIDTTTSFKLTMGCTRTMEDCRKFQNAANFQGEPYVPGIEPANRIVSGN